MKIQLRKKHWVVLGNNGEVMLTSEVYFSRRNARRAAKSFARANSLEYIEHPLMLPVQKS